jgi:NAD(P)-dependent dehydrogenase (short-subunit alcohol dehydrogenase family)
MTRFNSKKILITGAGSGIGRATALAFAREGAQVIAVDIGEAGLSETARLIAAQGGSCETHIADVSSESAMRALADTVHAAHGALDVLVNNAGIGASGRFLDTKVETWDRVHAINVRGVMLGCKLFIPPMVARGRGHVVNTASMAGYFAAPDLPVYAASKFAVLGFSESLRIDLKPKGIGVSAICPGIINTNIVATTVAEGESAKWQAGAVAFYQKRNYGPEKVASAILKAVQHNRAVVPVSPEAWFGYYVKRFFPGLARALAGNPLPFMKP